jgi:hypothetical protein
MLIRFEITLFANISMNLKKKIFTRSRAKLQDTKNSPKKTPSDEVLDPKAGANITG